MNEERMQKALSQLARKMGAERATSLLNILGRDKQFINALESDAGKELLKDAVAGMEHCIELILAEKDSEKNRSMLQAYRTIVNKWSGIIARYNKNQEVFEKNSE